MALVRWPAIRMGNTNRKERIFFIIRFLCGCTLINRPPTGASCSQRERQPILVDGANPRKPGLIGYSPETRRTLAGDTPGITFSPPGSPAASSGPAKVSRIYPRLVASSFPRSRSRPIPGDFSRAKAAFAGKLGPWISLRPSWPKSCRRTRRNCSRRRCGRRRICCAPGKWSRCQRRPSMGWQPMRSMRGQSGAFSRSKAGQPTTPSLSTSPVLKWRSAVSRVGRPSRADWPKPSGRGR